MGVGNCEDRREASLLFVGKSGAPLREDIVHLAKGFCESQQPKVKG